MKKEHPAEQNREHRNDDDRLDESGSPAAAPGGPLMVATPICFSPNGRVNQLATCPTTSQSTGNGATIFFDTKAGDKKYRLVVWGLTGMPKLMDQW